MLINFSPLPQKKNCVIDEIRWKNIVELCRLQITIWRMVVACWIPKATNMHSQ